MTQRARNRSSKLRLKPKKKANRYDPNYPDWRAVHMPWFPLPFTVR